MAATKDGKIYLACSGVNKVAVVTPWSHPAGRSAGVSPAVGAGVLARATLYNRTPPLKICGISRAEWLL